MESSTTTSAARRSEDIALDLLKFLASHANLGNKSSTTTPGFGASVSGKSEDQITQLLDLYGRCREAVELPVPVAAPAVTSKK